MKASYGQWAKKPSMIACGKKEKWQEISYFQKEYSAEVCNDEEYTDIGREINILCEYMRCVAWRRKWTFWIFLSNLWVTCKDSSRTKWGFTQRLVYPWNYLVYIAILKISLLSLSNGAKIYQRRYETTTIRDKLRINSYKQRVRS